MPSEQLDLAQGSGQEGWWGEHGLGFRTQRVTGRLTWGGDFGEDIPKVF